MRLDLNFFFPLGEEYLSLVTARFFHPPFFLIYVCRRENKTAPKQTVLVGTLVRRRGEREKLKITDPGHVQLTTL